MRITHTRKLSHTHTTMQWQLGSPEAPCLWREVNDELKLIGALICSHPHTSFSSSSPLPSMSFDKEKMTFKRFHSSNPLTLALWYIGPEAVCPEMSTKTGLVMVHSITMETLQKSHITVCGYDSLDQFKATVYPILSIFSSPFSIKIF